MRRTAREIGLFETAVNIARVRQSAEVVRKAGAAMPLPDADIEERVAQAARGLLDFHKSKYLFLTPEIALVEAMAKQTGGGVETMLAVPCDMDREAKERLKQNLPRGIGVTVLEEPYFPEDFFPGNGLLVVCGYGAGERAMTLPETYRMVEHYSGFLGKKVFVPYVELSGAVRYDGWMEVSRQRFTEKWRMS